MRRGGNPARPVVPTAAQKAARIAANAAVMREIQKIRDDHLSVRVPADLKATLQQLADAEHRKLADYVHHALQQHVEAITRRASRQPSKLKRSCEL
jgi:predicted DNA-binding protein